MLGEPIIENNIQDWVVPQGEVFPTLTEKLTDVNNRLEFLELSPETKVLHDKTIEVFSGLAENADISYILAQYCEAIENSDLRETVKLFEEIEGAEQLTNIARGNYISQADRLLLGVHDVVNNGVAYINIFGAEKRIDSLDKIFVILQKIALDMRSIRDIIESSTSNINIDELRNTILSRLEVYMFDGKNLERETANNNVAVITKDGDDKFIELLRQQNILSPAESAVASDNKNNGILSEKFPEHATSRGLTSRIDLANSGDRETDNIFLEMGEIPKTVIVHVPDEDSFSSIKGDHYAYQYMFIDWFRLPFKDRPKVIMYTDRFKPPLYIKHSYQGFMFCSTPDELRNVMKLTDQMQKNLEEEIYNPSKLELGQKEAYNNSDLREWENKTADTYQSLKHLFNRINYRNNLHDDYYRNRYSSLFEKDQRGKLKWKVGADSEVTPMRQIRTILDLGGGEGREDIPLVLEGFKVLNLDLSSTQLDKTYNRVHEELEGLKGNLHNNELSYNALSQLQMEGVVGPISFSTEREVNDNYLRVEGSFFDLQYELNKALVEWNDRFPETDPYDFFNTTRYKEEAFSDPRDMFADVGFDMAMFNWHTFCETGSPENQKNVLEQILNVIWPGGELVLEIPDRKFEPYASALKAYHEEHPDEPYGTIRDKKPDDFDMDNPDRYYPPRYFPDINELVLLLKSVGFEIGEDDIQTYLIESTDLDGKRTMTLKEHFITARKSKT